MITPCPAKFKRKLERGVTPHLPAAQAATAEQAENAEAGTDHAINYEASPEFSGPCGVVLSAHR